MEKIEWIKNKHLMNVALEQGEPFWLVFERGVLKWKASEIRPTSDDEYTFGDEENMISSSDHNLETAKKEELQIDISDLGNLEQLKIVVYNDASFGNLTDGGSKRGYILFGWKQ